MLFFVALVALRAPALVLHPSSVVTPDLIDPVFHIWAVASSIHHSMAWNSGLWSVFDANIYYPTPHPVAYTDVVAGLLPLSLPLHALMPNPVVLLNALLILSFALSAYGAFVLGYVTTRSYWAGLVSGIVFGFCPLRAEHLGHLNILSTEWLIAAAVCIVVAWDQGKLRWWVLAGFLTGLAAVSNLYYLAYLATPILVVALVVGRRWTRAHAHGALLAAGIAVVIVTPFICPYALRHTDALGPGYGAAGSIDVLDFLRVLQGRPIDSLALPVVPLQMMQPNHGFFPGLAAIFLAVVAWRGRRGRLWAVFALACAAIALGPALDIDGRILPVPLPYAALQRIVPFFGLFRDPPRALIGFYLGLAALCAWGMRDLLHALPSRKKRALCGILGAGLVALELSSPIPTRTLAAIPAGELWLARQPRIKVVLELPIANTTPLDWQRQSEIMYDSTAHWKNLINGSSSVEPSGMAARRAVLGAYPSSASIRLARQLGVDAVVLRLAWLSSEQRKRAEAACHAVFRDRIEEICVDPRT